MITKLIKQCGTIIGRSFQYIWMFQILELNDFITININNKIINCALIILILLKIK